MSTAQQTAIKAAMSVARDVTEGRINPDELGRVAADDCRELFGTVAGPDDPLWSLHGDIARQVLALGGVPADELTEWLAVARLRAKSGQTSPDGPRSIHRRRNVRQRAAQPRNSGAQPEGGS